MAQHNIGSLVADIALETATLRSDVAKANNHFKNLERKTNASLRNVRNSAQALVGVLGAIGFGTLVKGAIDSADQIGKLSTRLGASTEALSQYKHVAELSGVSFNTLTMGLQRMTRRVAEAAQGTGEAQGALRELNLDAQDLAQLAPEDQFEIIADRLNQVGSQSDKVRLAMKLFDSEGVSLLQTMSNGADGIQAMRMEADALGLTMSGQFVKDSEAAKDALARLDAASEGLALSFAQSLGPGLADITNWMAKELPLAAVESTKMLIALESGAKSLGIKFLEFVGAGSGGTVEAWKHDLKILEQAFIDLETRAFRSSSVLGGNGAGGGAGTASGVGGAAPVADTAGRVQEDQFAAQFDALSNSLMREEDRINESYANRAMIIEEAFQNLYISDAERKDLLFALAQDHEKALTRLTEEETRKRAALEADVQNRIASMRQSVTSLSIGLLKSLGRESKDWARAAILLEKGLNIARAKQNTAVAVSKALALDPLGGLAARVQSLGNYQVGLIAATGLVELGSVGDSGGSGLGFNNEPIDAAGGGGGFGADAAAPTVRGAGQGVHFHLHIDGNVYANDDFRMAMVDAFATAVDNDEIPTNIRVTGGD
ncbi:MAG: hypothetical protein QNJ78_06410 [Gammaproteobacteria bacterium]|nr:hypothetical protein [Gammaproteobacteria bacterium]